MRYVFLLALMMGTVWGMEQKSDEMIVVERVDSSDEFTLEPSACNRAFVAFHNYDKQMLQQIREGKELSSCQRKRHKLLLKRWNDELIKIWEKENKNGKSHNLELGLNFLD